MAMPKQSYTQTAGRLRQRGMTSSNAVTSGGNYPHALRE